MGVMNSGCGCWDLCFVSVLMEAFLGIEKRLCGGAKSMWMPDPSSNPPSLTKACTHDLSTVLRERWLVHQESTSVFKGCFLGFAWTWLLVGPLVGFRV